MDSNVKQQLDELRSKLKQQCNSIQEMAIKSVVGLVNSDVTVEACDDGIFLKNEKIDSKIFVKSSDISNLIRVLRLFT